jgi:exodeoxyribonuclease VIII
MSYSNVVKDALKRCAKGSAMNANPKLWNCTNEEYHGDSTHVSHSSLDCLIASQVLYHGKYVTGIFPQETTPAMEFGTMFHGWTLEKRVPIVAPKCDRRTKEGKEQYAAFLNAAKGKPVIDEKDNAMALAMIDGINANPAAKFLLDHPGEIEQGVRWTCSETGILLKCRPDKFITDRRLVIDLKTCVDSSPEGFARSAYAFGYHRQAALYIDGMMELTGEQFGFMFIAVQKTAPFSCLVCKLDDAFVEQGRTENLAGLAKLKRCRETNQWTEDHHGLVVTLPAPRWAKYANEYEV